MGRYILRRLVTLIPVMIGVSLLIFIIMRIAPGDVAAMILVGEEGGQGQADAEALNALREQLGLNEPYHIQYLDWMGGLIQLDAGTSLWTDRPVFEVLRGRIGVTFELALLAVLVSLVIAIPLGVLSAVYQDRWVDYLFRMISIAGLSIPNFWLGVITIIALTRFFNWSPPLGYTGFFDDPGTNIRQLFWPVVILGYSNAAIVARMTRSAMLEVLRDDYIRTARAKGLRGLTVVMSHGFRNALLPVITLSSLQFGNLIGGTVIIETVFTLPGVGRFLVDAITRRDYPVVQTIIVLSALAFVIINLLVDVLYAWLDPRIRYT